MSKPVYKAGSSPEYKRARRERGEIINVGAELSGEHKDKFLALKESLGCGSTKAIIHLLNNQRE